MKKLKVIILLLFAQQICLAQTEEIRYKLEDWDGSSTDYANLKKGYVFEVGMGNYDFGFGNAGIEMKNPTNIHLNLLESTPYKAMDENSFVGFVLDYRTSKGYVRRVLLGIGGTADSRRKGICPSWGTKNIGHQIKEIGLMPFYNIDIKSYAPQDWDGTLWFTTSIQNTGANTHLMVKMTKPFN